MENKVQPPKAKLFNLKRFFMDMARIVCSPLLLWYNLKRVYINDNAKKKLHGGAIIAANHLGFSDPFILGCTFWYRRMFFLAAEVVMKPGIIGWLLKGVGCIKIDRNICDMDAIRKSTDRLKEGHLLTVFPQGGIDRNEDVTAIKSGIVLLAMQSKTPIVPVFIHKKTSFFDRNTVVIGEPIAPPSVPGIAAIQEYADKILDKMTECREHFEKTEEK